MTRFLNTLCFVSFFVSIAGYVIGADLLAIVSMFISGIAALIEYTIN
jgi:hypothetical protein